MASRSRALVGSVIDASTTLLASQTHDVVRFAMGAPSDDLMPIELLDHYAAARASGKYSYGSSEGEPALIAQILERLAPHAGGDPRRITITTGGMQGLDLAFKLFVDPDDLVAVEAPTYTNGTATALSYGAQVLEIPVDESGMDVQSLEQKVRDHARVPKVIYTIPNFQNPSGVTLSRDRRLRLIELAERWGSVIVDDDPYGRLRFTGDAIASFQELSPRDPRIFSVRTFSKILAPGLRLGWIEADSSLQPLLINAKQAMDTCTSVPTQVAIARFLADERLETHLGRVTDLYHERKRALRAAIQRTFGHGVTVTDPDGGFFLWATFTRDRVDTDALFQIALKEGVAYIPGSAFSITGSFRNSLRLSFATSSPRRIDVGVHRLRAAVEQLGHPRGPYRE